MGQARRRQDCAHDLISSTRWAVIAFSTSHWRKRRLDDAESVSQGRRAGTWQDGGVNTDMAHPKRVRLLPHRPPRPPATPPACAPGKAVGPACPSVYSSCAVPARGPCLEKAAVTATQAAGSVRPGAAGPIGTSDPREEQEDVDGGALPQASRGSLGVPLTPRGLRDRRNLGEASSLS